jgi:hypothetical protein
MPASMSRSWFLGHSSPAGHMRGRGFAPQRALAQGGGGSCLCPPAGRHPENVRAPGQPHCPWGRQSRSRHTALLLRASQSAAPSSPAAMRRCVPSPWCAEAGLVYAQGLLLVARSLITELVSRLEGYAGRWIIQKNPQRLSRVLASFVAVRCGCQLARLPGAALLPLLLLLAWLPLTPSPWPLAVLQVSVPAAVVNAGLKYMQRRIKLAFQRRLVSGGGRPPLLPAHRLAAPTNAQQLYHPPARSSPVLPHRRTPCTKHTPPTAPTMPPARWGVRRALRRPRSAAAEARHSCSSSCLAMQQQCVSGQHGGDFPPFLWLPAQASPPPTSASRRTSRSFQAPRPSCTATPSSRCWTSRSSRAPCPAAWATAAKPPSMAIIWWWGSCCAPPRPRWPP